MTKKKYSDRQSSLSRDGGRPREISVGEVARFLKRLSSLYRDPKTGNPALGNALAVLALALDQRRDLTMTKAVSDLGASIEYSRSMDANKLRDLGVGEVKNMLSDQAFSKAELVDLGAERFAISRSRLMRLNMSDIVEVIRSALRHEESLGIISREAQRGGKERSS